MTCFQTNFIRTTVFFCWLALSWLLALTLGCASAYAQSPITMTLTSPSTQPNFTTSRNAVTLRGTASSPAGIQQLNWWIYYYENTGEVIGTDRWEINNLPLRPGANQVWIYALDFAGNQASFVVNINCQPENALPQIVVTSPAAGQAVTPGTAPLIAWEISGVPPADWLQVAGIPRVALALFRNGVKLHGLSDSIDYVTNLSSIVLNAPVGDGYQIQVSSVETIGQPGRFSGLSAPFRIGPSGPPVISSFTAVAPNGNESTAITIKLGETLNFRWKTTGGYVSQASISPNVGDVTGRNSKLIPTTQIGQFTYTLNVANVLGSASSQVTVNVVSNDVVNTAEVLYNGIVLGHQWPPKPADYPDTTQLPPYLVNPPAVIPINVGRQLFVDDFLIETSNLTRQWHAATMHPGNPVLWPSTNVEKAGEGPMAMPFSNGVFYDPADKLFKAWYMCGYRINVCYATSTDGVNWIKPNLDVVPGTNVIFKDTRKVDTYTNWIDLEDPNPARRYKMMRVVYPNNQPLQYEIHYSADGIHWGPAVVTSIAPKFDRTTFFFNPFRKKWGISLKELWPGPYRLRRYVEHDDLTFALNSVVPNNPSSVEMLQSQTSKWFKADALDTAHPEDPTFTPNAYALDAAGYESLMLAQFSILRGNANKPSGRPKMNEVYFGFSRDGFHWHRPNRQAMFTINSTQGAWNWGNVQPLGGGPLIVGDQMYFYFSGRGGRLPGAENSNDSNGAMGLATMRRDGFASLNATATESSVTTRRISFDGRYLFVNADIASGGHLCAEVLDENGQAIAPFTKANCQAMTGNSTKQLLSWNGGNDLGSLANRTVKLRFYVKNGKLYSFWVSPTLSGESRGYVGAGGPAFASYRDSSTGVTPPAPRVSLTPGTQTVTTGQAATLAYSVSNATSANFSPALPGCTITLSGGNASGNCTVPTASAGTFTYTLQAQGNGQTVSASAQIVVSATVVDTIAPTVTLTSPTQNLLAAGTQQVTLAVTTNENAICRYTRPTDTNFAQAQGFTQTGALAHAVSLPTLDGQSYSYLVRCTDAAGNASAALAVNFSVSNPIVDTGGNRAVLFDGKTGAVTPSTKDIGFPLRSWTMETWLNTSAQKTEFMTVLGNNSGNELRITSGADAKATVTVYNGGWSHFTGTKKINDGRWHHVVAVRDNDKLMLYVDGQPDTDAETRQTFKTMALPTVANVLNLRAIGKRGTDHEFYEGQVDEVRLLGRALSASEIAARYNNGQGLPLGNETGLLMGFNFNETSGVAIDASVNHYHGTLSNTGATRVASTRGSGMIVPQITSFTIARTTPAGTPSNTATIALGQSVTLAWSLLNAQTAAISGTNCQNLTLPQGSCQHTPTTTGSFTYTLTAQGNGQSVTSAVTVTVVTDTVAPTVTITAAPATTTTALIRLAGQAQDNNGVTAVTFSTNRGATGTATGTTNWSADVPLQSGPNVITVQATDAAGNRGTASVTVTYNPPTVDTTPPTITLAIPTTDLFPLGTRLIAIEVHTNENASCRMALDAVTPFAAMLPFGQTGALTHVATLPTLDGKTYTPVIRCTDTAGNVSAARTLNIRVATYGATAQANPLTFSKSTEGDKEASATQESSKQR